MVFTSINFLLSFLIVLIIYYILPYKYRWQFILIVSLLFYVNIKPVYVFLLGFVSFITYYFALLIQKEESETRREWILAFGIFLILLPLLFFKYYNFLNEILLAVLQTIGIHWDLPELTMMLPIGISFYTFMAIGYVVDVYNEELNAEKNFGFIMLFLSFFPLVLSGPIERAPSMLPQFRGKLIFNYQMAVKGFQMMLWGYFMKLVIADRLAIYLNPIFNSIEEQSGGTLLLATLLYPVQVYGDLGGYSLMAIGAASIMGVKVRQNFNRPFFATSMSEFWRRWHMSLITWITDYLYTPLSFTFRKLKIWGIVIALICTFLIAGLWHGATISFMLWGLIQGVILSFEALTKKRKTDFEEKYSLNGKSWYILLGIIVTYLLFSFSLVFGGAFNSISESLLVIERIFINSDSIYIESKTLIYALIGFSILFLSEFLEEFFPGKILFFKNKNTLFRRVSYYIILFLVLVIGVFETDDFIYFQF